MPSRWLRCRDRSQSVASLWRWWSLCLPGGFVAETPSPPSAARRLAGRYAFPVASLPRPVVPVTGLEVSGSLCLPGGFVAETRKENASQSRTNVVMPSRWLRCRDDSSVFMGEALQRRYAFPVASLPRLAWVFRQHTRLTSLCLPGGFVAETSLQNPEAASRTSLCLPGGFVAETRPVRASETRLKVVMPSRWLRCRDFMNKSNARGASRRYAFPVASLPRPSRIRCGLLCGMVVMPSRWLRCRDQVEKTCITLHVSRYAFPVASLPRLLHPPASRPFSSSLCLPGGFVAETYPLRYQEVLGGVVMPSRWLRYRDHCTLPHHAPSPRRYAFPVASLPRRFRSGEQAEAHLRRYASSVASLLRLLESTAI